MIFVAKMVLDTRLIFLNSKDKLYFRSAETVWFFVFVCPDEKRPARFHKFMMDKA
jgi:hypothetical protein